jgi:hypothetical protein
LSFFGSLIGSEQMNSVLIISLSEMGRGKEPEQMSGMGWEKKIRAREQEEEEPKHI